MKKFILPILLFLMFIPLYVNAETCDTDKITIDNITIENKSDNVKEIDQATANGKNINLNLSMSEVGDKIEYKFVVKNDSNEDYELDKTSLNIKSDYINYSFETEDNSNIVKVNSSKNVTLRVEYKTEVPEDKFENGSYNDNKTMIVQLSNGNTINVPDTLKNPNTGVQSYILILFIILLISITTYLLLKKKKYTEFMILIIGTAIIFPISVYAICKYKIKIESNITIRETREVTFYKQWKLYSKSYEYMMVPTNEFYKYLDLYMTSYNNYDAEDTKLIPSGSLKKVDFTTIPIITEISTGDDYKPTSGSWINHWYKITYNVPKYDEDENELHYVLKENHIYGLDLLGGGPEGNLGVMAFDPYDKNYNKVGITDEERELLIGACKNTTETNDEIPYVDCLPFMITPNEHYLFGVGEGKTLFNGVVHFMDGMILS